MRCFECRSDMQKCEQCGYVFERLSEISLCVMLGSKKFHFCNDDCVVDFIFTNNVVESYTSE
jgi:hypothetical protein